MEVDYDPKRLNGENAVRTEIAQLQRDLQEERDSHQLLQSQSDFAKLAATQEIEKYRRECFSLREAVARLSDDCTTVRERGLRDQETIKGLTEELESKESEFAVKYVELKTEIRDLDCGRKRDCYEVEQWKTKCSQLEAQLAKLVHEGKEFGEPEHRKLNIAEEKSHLAEKDAKVNEESFVKSSQKHAGEVDDELPKREKKSSWEDSMSSLEPSRKIPLLVVLDSDSDDDAEDWINVDSQLSKKRLIDAGDTPSRECSVTGANITSVEVTDVQTPLCLANDSEERNRSLVSKKKFRPSDLIRSSTARSRGSTRRNSVSNKGALAHHKRYYVGRIPSPQQCKNAEKRAEELRRKLRPCKPSFVKLMAQSHVSGCFWLNIPTKFCNMELPTCELKMILEDENGGEHVVNYIGHNCALSGGWIRFALDHNLELGDALIFELREPTRFKVYIIKAIPEESCEDPDNEAANEQIRRTNGFGSHDGTEDQDVDLCDVW